MVDEESIKLYSIEISLMIIGMFGNIVCCILMSRNRLMPDRNVNMNAILSFIQSVLDFFSCLFYIISLMDYPKITNVFVGMFVCRILKSKALFWMTSTLRAGVNIIIAILTFIKLLYPFLRSASNLIMFLTVGLGLLFSVSFLQVVPHIGMVSFIRNSKLQNCNFTAMESFKGVTKLVGILRFFAIFNFTYLYTFPITSTLFVYRQIYHCLKDSEDVPRQIVLKEIMKSFLLDTVFYCFCFSYYCIFFLLSQFNEKYIFLITSKSYRIGMILVVMYAVIYPYISLAIRRAYKKPIADVIKILGLKAPSSILRKHSAQRFGVSAAETASAKFTALFQRSKASISMSKRTSSIRQWSDDASF